MPSKDRQIKNAANRRYYSRNRDRILAGMKDKQKEIYQRWRVSKLAATRRFIEKNYELSLYRNIRSRCLKRGIPFDIEVSDIVIPEICPYLGTPITKIQGEGHVWTNASLDRINPELGYIKGNVQVISNQANVMKNKATMEELITFSKNVLLRHTQQIKEILK